jgi:hypothetical protein
LNAKDVCHKGFEIANYPFPKVFGIQKYFPRNFSGSQKKLQLEKDD